MPPKCSSLSSPRSSEDGVITTLSSFVLGAGLDGFAVEEDVVECVDLLKKPKRVFCFNSGCLELAEGMMITEAKVYNALVLVYHRTIGAYECVTTRGSHRE